MADDVSDPWLTAEQMQAWLPLGAVIMALPAALDAQLKRDGGLNLFEYLILAGLSEAPDRSLATSSLAAFTQGSLSRLSHAVTRLVAAGWVERRPGAAGPRHTVVTLTPAGWRHLQKVAPGHAREVQRLVFESLSREQVRSLSGSMSAIASALDPQLASELKQRMDAIGQ